METKQRGRAAHREAMALDDDREQDGLTIELGERPDAAASQPAVIEKPKVADEDPLEALKKQFADVQAERDAEKKRATELETRSREQQQQIERHQDSEIANHKAVLEQAYSVEEGKLAEAKRKYAAAMREQDFDGAADAQHEMIRISGMMGQYSNAYQELERRERAPKPATATDDRFETALKSMEPRVAAWAREHKDDVRKPERQKLAFAADAMAQAKGFAPGSDEYLDFMDDQMGYSGPDDDPSGSEPPQQQRQPAQSQQRASKRAPAAPPSRNSASAGGRRKVHLTEDDIRHARNLGLTQEEYAKAKLNAERNGDLNGGARESLHFKTVA
jgi:hypothetical protein